MNIEQMFELILTAGMYIFGGWVYVSYAMFVLKEIAPKVMTGKATLRDYISFFAGALFVLFLLAFGSYYLGQAMLYGWNGFKTVIVEITDDVINDFDDIYQGEDIQIESTPPIFAPENEIVIPTPDEPFDFNTWTPDQPVPTPEP